MVETKETIGFQEVSAEALLKALSVATEVIYRLDVRRQTFQWFGELEALFGPCRPEQIHPAAAFLAHIAEEDRQRRLEALHQHLLNQAPFSCRYRYHRFDGGYEWFDETGVAELDEQGEPVAIIGRIMLVTSEELRRQDLEQRSRCDELTGLLNRQALRQSAGDLFRDAVAQHMRIGVLVLEIDKMSMINHSYGSDVGDQVVGWIANQLVGQTGAGGLLGRIDSNKFALVLPDCEKDNLRAKAEALLQIASDNAIATHAGPVRAGLTIGGIIAPDEADDIVSALGRAEEALEDTKRSGRGKYVEFIMQRHRQRAGRKSLAVADEVLRAMELDRLKLAFQPIVEASSRRPVHFETLVRLEQPDGRIVAPGMFLPAMEESGHVTKLDAFVLSRAIQALRDFPMARLAVNVSGLTVIEADAVSALLRQLRAAEDICDRLTLEITETVAVDDMQLSARFARAVRSAGCCVALDDFGSGYTSFQQLKSMEVDMVKIDAEFVMGITKSRKNRQLVTAMVDTCRAFGFDVVAEGVTSSEEADLLAAIGVGHLQGYYFGRPDFAALKNIAADPEPALPFDLAAGAEN
jgi:diguanylate cyclase (GGDEF)-like protein